MAKIVEFDAIHFPPPGAEAPALAPSLDDVIDDLSELEISDARDLIKQEIATLGQPPSTEDFIKAWEQCQADIAFHPATAKYVRMSKAFPADRIASFSASHDVLFINF